MTDAALRLLAGLLPVLLFLVSLIVLDSYKLVRPVWIGASIVFGGLTAGLSFFLNDAAMLRLELEAEQYTRYGAPVIEELVKALFLVYLIRGNRVGFLVDAAILGFAIGTGFAIVENTYYLQVRPGSGIGVWVIRGFGTAVMHGGTTCVFGILSQAMTERRPRNPLGLLPGWLLAVGLHSAYNHFFLSPNVGALAVLALFPPLLLFVFRRSERALRVWLDVGFDADAELLELIGSGRLSESNVGRYLQTLRRRFRGEVVADLICYLKLHIELSLRAKGLLLARENGFDVPLDDDTDAKITELEYLERSIGRTGKLAMAPLLDATGKRRWQRHMLRQ